MLLEKMNIHKLLYSYKYLLITVVLISVFMLMLCCCSNTISSNEQIFSTGNRSPQIKSTEVNNIAFRMVKIPAGKFTMGSPPNEKDREDDEGPQHRISLDSFWLGETEVTQGLWEAVMGKNPSHFLDCGNKCPVEQVSWNDIQIFIEKLNQCNEKNKYRLPTEAEWEYACRAGSTGRFSFGNYDIFFIISKYAWYGGSSLNGKTHSVAKKRPNAFGLYDMHGNVSEWCHDWYNENYYSQSPEFNPIGPQSGNYRVIRGGSWLTPADSLRSADRGRHDPDARHYRFLGLRLAMDHKD